MIYNYYYDVLVTKGVTLWYRKDTKILHRENGPAIEYSLGGWAWYKDGKLHRIDGPAVKYSTLGTGAWFLDGIQYTEEDWKEALNSVQRRP